MTATQQATHGIPFATDIGDNTVTWNLGSSPHAFLEGPTGSGKTHSLQIIASGGLNQGMKVYIVDINGQGRSYGFAQGQAEMIATDHKTALSVLASLEDILDHRHRLMREHEVSRYLDLPAAHREPRVLLIVDGINALAGSSHNDHVPPLIQRLAKEGSAAHITLAFAAQSITPTPDRQWLADLVSSGFARAEFGQNWPREYGHGTWSEHGQDAPRQMQVWAGPDHQNAGAQHSS